MVDIEENFLKMYAEIEHNIVRYGQHLIGVPHATGTFVYTIGLSDRGWPEIIVKGLPYQVGGQLLNDLLHICEARGTPPLDGEQIEELANLPTLFRPVSEFGKSEYMCQAIFRQERLSRPPIKALQLIWPDKAGNFPGSGDMDSQMELMQNLDEPANPLLQ